MLTLICVQELCSALQRKWIQLFQAYTTRVPISLSDTVICSHSHEQTTYPSLVFTCPSNLLILTQIKHSFIVWRHLLVDSSFFSSLFITLFSSFFYYFTHTYTKMKFDPNLHVLLLRMIITHTMFIHARKKERKQEGREEKRKRGRTWNLTNSKEKHVIEHMCIYIHTHMYIHTHEHRRQQTIWVSSLCDSQNVQGGFPIRRLCVFIP